MLVIIVVAFAAIGARLAFIQGVDAKHYLAVGDSEWQHTVILNATRGAILDRDGNELAVSIPQTTIYADPHLVTNPNSESAKLAPVLKLSPAALRSLLTEPDGFVYLAHTQPDSVATAVTKLDLPGIYTQQEPKRFNPDGQLALPLLGEVGTEGEGLSGLEAEYNTTLSGTPGKSVEQLDPQGRQVPGGVDEYQAPKAGNDLVLSIDSSLQYETEQALAQAIVTSRGHSGIAILMDTQTGDLLAVADLSMPSAAAGTAKSPPAVSTVTPSLVRNAKGKLVSAVGPQPVESPDASAFDEVYEPGSVMKLITISAALATKTVVPADHFIIPDHYYVGGTWFRDAEYHPAEDWSVTDILANSSDIGTIQIAKKLGKTRLLQYMASYGIGARSDVKFPGESQGLLPSYWSNTSIATVPIGQGISVTAIQMISAYNAVANGGVYVAPRLVEGTVNAQGKMVPTPIVPGHRVVSTTVADQMRTMLEQVVTNGTGTSAAIDPYTVAGKTGTAEVPVPGGYEGGHYVASFAGYVPAEKPTITAMVQIYDTPDFGAAASAPAFSVIGRDALTTLDVAPPLPLPAAPGVPLATTSIDNPFGELAPTTPTTSSSGSSGT
jgi:cell division protein FtsI (penicillin-binding protein 3)